MRLYVCVLALVLIGATAAHAEPYEAPRAPGTEHPDLNGIWQALNTANYDIEPHLASHSMQLRDGPRRTAPGREDALPRRGGCGSAGNGRRGRREDPV